MIRRAALFLILASVAIPATGAPPPPRAVRVELNTGAGKILLEIDVAHAPITAGNFLRYVDARRFDGTTFYRAARSKSRPGVGLVQGGIDDALVRSFFPIAHEPTSRTGLRHVDGTVSMARNEPGSAMGDFFITVGPAPSLDAAPGYPGYAAFGHVAAGMEIIRRILTLPTYTGGLSAATMGQTIIKPVRILTARRVR